MSSAGGATATLLGVVTGAVLSTRAQRRHWARDRQVEACQAIIAESTKCQLALRRKWRHGEAVDWTAWNEALALMWLVGSRKVIRAAYRMDEVFWLQRARIDRGEITDEASWEQARDEMESTRLRFINATRNDVLQKRGALTEKPVARPPLPSPRHQPTEAVS
ncbi:hypothetical protein [Thermomonospora cellulosilytica]|uniref:Uncharacterized protein n=1 Tax=Thermomonospora cellulosilytica TaxID=1411118 RepID=A0A7W3MYI3_9ACTN|nr:hypothetical protein [Thermomonospora cellulosilytica]MBA9004235.1 hypothetical protein [Thermomonospora cellulosilytica]